MQLALSLLEEAFGHHQIFHHLYGLCHQTQWVAPLLTFFACIITSKVTTPQDAHGRLVLQVYLGSDTSDIRR